MDSRFFTEEPKQLKVFEKLVRLLFGEAQSVATPTLCITRKFSRHPLDYDSLAYSNKAITDGLVVAGALPGDAPNDITQEYRQEKVSHDKDTGILIEIEYETL